MGLLKVQDILHTETSNGRLRSRQSRITSLSSSDYLLAATVICLDLSHGLQMQNSGPLPADTYTWDWECRNKLDAIKRTKEIWDESRDISMEAFKASSVLGLMLNKVLQTPGVENGPGVAVEPTDEKQNAAMTLGLLSSGMSPTSQGQTQFSDQLFRSNDASMGAGVAEIPGAPSPFSSMFGQMPDMQVNLDWVSS